MQTFFRYNMHTLKCTDLQYTIKWVWENAHTLSVCHRDSLTPVPLSPFLWSPPPVIGNPDLRHHRFVFSVLELHGRGIRHPCTPVSDFFDSAKVVLESICVVVLVGNSFRYSAEKRFFFWNKLRLVYPCSLSIDICFYYLEKSYYKLLKLCVFVYTHVFISLR